jgi:hypothetical protein
LQKQFAELQFADSLSRGIHDFAGTPRGVTKHLSVPHLFDDYVTSVANNLDKYMKDDDDETLKAKVLESKQRLANDATRDAELRAIKRDLLNQEAGLESERGIHKVSFLLIACYEDKGMFYPFDACAPHRGGTVEPEAGRGGARQAARRCMTGGAAVRVRWRGGACQAVHDGGVVVCRCMSRLWGALLIAHLVSLVRVARSVQAPGGEGA